MKVLALGVHPVGVGWSFQGGALRELLAATAQQKCRDRSAYIQSDSRFTRFCVCHHLTEMALNLSALDHETTSMPAVWLESDEHLHSSVP